MILLKKINKSETCIYQLLEDILDTNNVYTSILKTAAKLAFMC